MENTTSNKEKNKLDFYYLRYFYKKFEDRYLLRALNGMAYGLFSTLIVGLILKQIATYISFGFSNILLQGSAIATILTGAGIGIGVASALKAPRLVMVTTAVSGFIAAQSVTIFSSTTNTQIAFSGPGDPLSSFICSVLCCELGILISNKTRVDIIITPLLTLFFGAICSYFVYTPVSELMNSINHFIIASTELRPIFMSIIISITMGIALTLPISSAAISIILGLTGMAAGASTIGCSTQMIGFAVISFKANGINGLISQGIGTSMIQMPNIIKKPAIWIPPILASAIISPIGTVGFHMVNNQYGAGMGTSGLVGQIMTWQTMANSTDSLSLLLKIGIFHFILPALLTYIIYSIMCKYKIISFKDYRLENI